MRIIAHRRNTIEELKQTSPEYGIELDIRSFGTDLVVHHEPFVKGELFCDWLEHYCHDFLILNTKEEGLEQPILELMQERAIQDFFFLDQSFPFLVKTAETGESRCAVRFSEFESVETCLALKGLIDWVWVDCFSQLPLNQTNYRQLKKAGFKLCLVSPELQGRFNDDEIESMKSFLRESGMVVEAVCTKKMELWR